MYWRYTVRPRIVPRGAKVCRYARVLPVCRLPKKREIANAVSLFFGNRQRPILPGRVQVRYQTLALGSSLPLHSSYARYSVLSCDSGGTLPCCYQKKKATAFAIASFGNRQRPTLPSRVQLSTLGAEGLNYCVRDGNRCFPFAIVTGIVECVLRTFTTA